MTKEKGLKGMEGEGAAEWADRLAATLKEIRESEIARLDEHVRRLELARETVLTDRNREIQALEVRSKGVRRRLEAEPLKLRRSTKAFRLSGKVRLKGTDDPLPGLCFRIVDEDGEVVVEKAEWRTDSRGIFKVEAKTADLKDREGLRLELVDPVGKLIRRVSEVKDVTTGIARALEMEVAPSEGPMVETLAAHGGHERDALSLVAVEHDKALETHDAERKWLSAEFDRALYSSRKIRDGLEKGIHLPILIDGSWIEKPQSKRLVLHVTHEKSSNTWRILKAGVKEPLHTLRTKKEAVLEARKLAKANMPSQVKIHKRDGKIQEERTYGDDPKRSVG